MSGQVSKTKLNSLISTSVISAYAGIITSLQEVPWRIGGRRCPAPQASYQKIKPIVGREGEVEVSDGPPTPGRRWTVFLAALRTS
jgi:hypothetical protein